MWFEILSKKQLILTSLKKIYLKIELQRKLVEITLEKMAIKTL